MGLVLAAMSLRMQAQALRVQARVPVRTELPAEPALDTWRFRHWSGGAEIEAELAVAVGGDGSAAAGPRLFVDGELVYVGPEHDAFSAVLLVVARAEERWITRWPESGVVASGLLRFGSNLKVGAAEPDGSVLVAERWSDPKGQSIDIRLFEPVEHHEEGPQSRWRSSIRIDGVSGIMPSISHMSAAHALADHAQQLDWVYQRFPPDSRFQVVASSAHLAEATFTASVDLGRGEQIVRIGPMEVGRHTSTCPLLVDGREQRIVERTPLLCLVACGRLVRQSASDALLLL